MEQGSTNLSTFTAQHSQQSGFTRPGQTLTERIGNTPLLRIDQFTSHLPGVTLLGKAEWYNPGGSVKDRAAANIVAEGRRGGRFSTGKTCSMPPAATPASPMPCSARRKDFRSRSACPATFPLNVRKFWLPTAQIFCTPILAKVRTAQSDWRANWLPGIPIYISTPINIRTMPTGRRITTEPQTKSGSRRRAASHTSSPCSAQVGPLWERRRRLKELNPAIRCISLQPDSAFHGIEGAKHMASAIVPKNLRSLAR